MATNRDITFTLKVVNDAKAGLSAFGIDLSKLATNANALGDKTGVAQKRAAAGVREHATALKTIITQSTQASLAVNRLAQSYVVLNRLQSQANAGTRVDRARAREAETAQTNKAAEAELRLARIRAEGNAASRTVRARARTAESTATTRDAENALRVTTAAAMAQERVARAVNTTTIARAREAAVLAETQRRLADQTRTEAARAGIRVNRDQLALDAARASADVQKQVANSNALRTVRMNELAVQREQLRVEQQKVLLQREQLRNEALIAASKGRDLQLAQRLQQAEQRTAALRANAARSQALLANAQARNGNQGLFGGRGGRRPGLFSALTFGLLGSPASAGANVGIGGRGSAIWPGIGAAAGGISSMAGLGTVAKAGGLAYAAAEYVTMADTMRTLYARVGLVTEGVLQQSAAFKELQKVSQDTRAGIAEVTNVYYGLARSNNALGLSQREMLDITKGISQSIAISGVNAQAAAFGLMQLAQAFGSGQLRGDELNSVLEQLPALAQAIAKNIQQANGVIGVGTVGALKTLAEQGKLSVKQVVDAIKKSLNEFDTQFAKLPVTVSQGSEVMKTGLMVFVSEFDKATGATKGLGNALAELGRKLASQEFVSFAANFGNGVANAASVVGTILLPALRLAGAAALVLVNNLAPLLAGYLSFKALVGGAGALAALAKTATHATRVFGVFAKSGGILAGVIAALTSVVRGLGLAMMSTPVGWIAAAAAAAAFVGVKIYSSKKAAEAYAASLDELVDKGRELQKLTPQQRVNLDANQLSAWQQQAKDAIPQEAAKFAELEAQAAKARESARIAKEQMDAIRAQRGGQEPRADDMTPDARRYNQLKGIFSSASDKANSFNDDLKRIRGTLESLGLTAFETGKAIDEALENPPDSKIKGILTSEEWNKLRGWISSDLPQIGKQFERTESEDVLKKVQVGGNDTKELARIFNNLTPERSLDAFKRTPEGQRQGAVVDPSLAFDAYMRTAEGERLQQEALTRVTQQRNAVLNDNALAKARREASAEALLSQRELAAGGALPVDRRLMELAKQFAAERSPIAAVSGGDLNRAEAMRPTFQQEERRKIELLITQAATERLAVAESEYRLIGLTGEELLVRQVQEEQLRKALANNKNLRETDVALIVKATEATAKQAVHMAAVSTGVRNINEHMRKAALEATKAFAGIGDILAGGSGEDPLLDFQLAEADRLQMPFDQFLTSYWPEFLQKLRDTTGATELDFAKSLNDVNVGTALRDVATNVRDAVDGFADTWHYAAMAGDELERQQFVMEQIRTLMRDGKLTYGQAVNEVDQMLPAYIDAQQKARMTREDPVIAPVVGAQRGYTEFLTEAANLAQQVADTTKSAFEGLSNTVAEFVTTGKSSFKEFAASVMRDIAQMIVRFLVMRAVMAAVGWMTGGTVGLTQSQLAGAYAQTDALGSAKGNVFAHGKQVKEYARGGLVTKPTLFPMANGGVGLMGEAGAEAIMPLRRLSNGRLGVESQGGGTVQNVFAPQMSITVDGSKSGKPEENADLARKIGDQVGKMMDAKIADFAQRQSRPGGLFRSSEIN